MDLNESELNDLRNNIREIDKDLVSLFEKRLTLSKAVAAYKLKAEKPIFDEAREEKNIRAVSELLQHVSEKQNFIGWYTLLMDISKDIQKKLILGEKDD